MSKEFVKSWDAKKYKKTVDVAHLGKAVFDELQPVNNEKILDVGCGDGRNSIFLLTEYGKRLDITGIDYSNSMIEKANKQFEKLQKEGHKIQAHQGDAANLPFGTSIAERSFDAVVSVSALHWVKDAEGVAKCLAQALKPGGRLAVEFAWQSPPEIRKAIFTVMEKHGHLSEEMTALDPWRKTSPQEWRQLLLKNGFDHDLKITPISRWQPLEGKNGMKEWLTTFVADSFLSPIAPEKKDKVMDEICKELKSTALYKDGQWFAKYERLSIQATHKREKYISDVDLANSPFGKGSFTAKALANSNNARNI
jgi:ubiquinone/menaquinone biosynthesis C-methylase UbiE